jgi:hypothetical protein
MRNDTSGKPIQPFVAEEFASTFKIDISAITRK